MTSYNIGEWTFDPLSGELRRGEECRRLEHRAARMLQLLADAEGAIVPQDKIIGEVWNGRSLSDNSISVVVSQLRRLLDDDARRPLLIETVPKRGYRLVGLRSEASAAPKQRSAFARVLVPVAMALTLILGASAWLRSEPTVVKPSLTVTDVVNATGNGGHAPLARATSELIVDQLERRGFELRRGTQGSDLVVSSKLVMWDGAPYLGMTATDRRAVVRWSAMIRGDGGRIPAGVSAELDRFEAKIAEPEAAARLAPAQTDR